MTQSRENLCDCGNKSNGCWRRNLRLFHRAKAFWVKLFSCCLFQKGGHDKSNTHKSKELLAWRSGRWWERLNNISWIPKNWNCNKSFVDTKAVVCLKSNGREELEKCVIGAGHRDNLRKLLCSPTLHPFQRLHADRLDRKTFSDFHEVFSRAFPMLFSIKCNWCLKLWNWSDKSRNV